MAHNSKGRQEAMQVPRQVVMTPPSTLDNHKGEEEVSKLSKNQKRRRKRKSKTTSNEKTIDAPNKPVEQATLPATAPKPSSATLNPMAKVHNRLVEEGFLDKDVEKAMNEMWEKEMTGYDDYDAVVAYLRGTNEAQDESTAPSTAPSMTLDEPSLNGHAYEEAVEEEKEEIEDAISISTASSQQMDFAARLDMVADGADVSDSAYALAKWVAELAKQSELEGFCNGNKSRALFTVVRRTIEEQPSDLEAILKMVSNVFVKVGMDSLAVMETRGNLKLVLQQAQTAYSKNKQDQDSLAENVANALVTRISELVQELLSRRQDTNVPKSIRDLEQEIDSLSTSLNTLGQCGIVELVQNRDVQKAATDKALEVVDIVMGTANDDEASSIPISAVTKDQVLLSLVGEDGLEKMNANKLAHDAMRQKVKDAEERSSPEYQALKMNLSAFQGERSLVTEKIEKLKNELQKLQEEDTMLCGKIQEAQEGIAALDESSSGEMAKLQADLAKTSKVAESDVSVRTLADRMATFETSSKRSVHSASHVANGGDEEMFNVVPEKMNSYLVRARYYFRSEADCVQFLRSRVRNLETEANSMNNELEEFKSLGLSSNAKQLEGQLNEKVANIQEDNQAIEALCTEAAKTRDEIADKLELCGADLSSLNTSVLRGIVSAMVELEVDIGRLSQFVESSSNGYASNKAPQATSNGGSPSSNKATVDAAPAQLATKLTWAKNKDAKKTESLRSIQQEELSSKAE